MVMKAWIPFVTLAGLLVACNNDPQVPGVGSPDGLNDNKIVTAPTVTSPAVHLALARFRQARRIFAVRISPDGESARSGEILTLNAGRHLLIQNKAYSVLSEPLRLDSPQRVRLQEVIERLEANGPDKSQHFCGFSPGIAMLIDGEPPADGSDSDSDDDGIDGWRRTAVLLLCYQCQDARLYVAGAQGTSWKRSFFDPIAERALFAMAKELFPQDLDIQALTPASAKASTP